MTLTEIKDRVQVKIPTDPRVLSDVEALEVIKSTLQGQFSKDYPRKVTLDVIGTGDYDYPLPSVTNKAWQSGFSRINTIEFPVGNRIPTYIDTADWIVYDADTLFLSSISGTFQANETITGGTSSATGTITYVGNTCIEYVYVSGTFQANETITGGTSSATGSIESIETEKLRLLGSTPATTEAMRLLYSIAYTPATVANVPTNEQEALVILSASNYCHAISRYYAQTSDGAIDVDTVDYQSKSAEWIELAKNFKTAYYALRGSKGRTLAASVTGDQDTNYAWGGDFLLHPRKYR